MFVLHLSEIFHENDIFLFFWLKKKFFCFQIGPSKGKKKSKMWFESLHCMRTSNLMFYTSFIWNFPWNACRHFFLHSSEIFHFHVKDMFLFFWLKVRLFAFKSEQVENKKVMRDVRICHACILQITCFILHSSEIFLENDIFLFFWLKVRFLLSNRGK